MLDASQRHREKPPMAKEDDILRDAIIGTEKEIAASAFDKEDLDHDDTGDRSLESMGDGLEGQHEPDEEEDEDENPDENSDEDAHPSEEPENPDAVEATGDKPETKPEAQPEPQGRVPAGRLREEAERARAAIAERDAIKAQLDAEKAERIALNAKVDALLALQKAPAPQPTPQPEKPKTPDLFEDPNAFAEHINKGVQEQFGAFMKAQRDREVNASIEAARTRHGPVFEDAWKALSSLPKAPETAELVRRMEAMPNPGEAVVSWHKRNQAIREVGDDLAGYKAKLAEETRKSLMADPEFRKEILASLRGEATTGDQGRPRTAVRLPRSLSQAAGGNSRMPNDSEVFDGSEGAIAASAWSS
jgi:hypothetical protein